jgi:hypothetical protein
MFTRLLGRSVMGALVLGAAVASASNPAAAQTWTGGYIGGHTGALTGYGTDGTYCEDDYGSESFEPETASISGSESSGSESSSDQRPAFWLGGRPGDLVYEGMYCYDTKGAGTLNPYDGNYARFGYWDTYLYDGLDELRGHLIGAQLGLRVQAGTAAFAPVFGLQVAHSVLNATDWLRGEWGFGFGDYNSLAYTECCGFWVEWQGLFSLDHLTTATFSMGFGSANVLFYGEFGAAIGRASFTNNYGFNGTGTGFGPVWGAGVEVRIAPRLSIFSEFNRVTLNNIQMLGTNQAYGQTFPMLLDVNVHANIFKVGFNIQLGGN